MKNIVIIDPAVPQWKGNLHMHTNRSPDCHTDYHDALNQYKAQGYHFCLVSDHEKYWDSPEMDSKDFCVLSGVESAFWRNQTRDYMLTKHDVTSMHLNMIKDVTVTDAEPGYAHDQILPRPMDYGLDSWNDYIQMLRDKGHIVMLNHPNWSRLAPEMMLGIRGCFAFEIYNTSSILEVGCNDDEEIWDYCLNRGKFIYAAAGDDTHLYAGEGVCCGGGFNMVSAKELNAASLVTAMKAGQFYPSTGPVIHEMRVEDGTLYMRFSPAQSVRVIGGPGFGTGKAVPKGDTFTEYTWKVKDGLRFFRVTVTDPTGGIAWTQPVMMADLMDEPKFINRVL